MSDTSTMKQKVYLEKGLTDAFADLFEVVPKPPQDGDDE